MKGRPQWLAQPLTTFVEWINECIQSMTKPWQFFFVTSLILLPSIYVAITLVCLLLFYTWIMVVASGRPTFLPISFITPPKVLWLCSCPVPNYPWHPLPTNTAKLLRLQRKVYEGGVTCVLGNAFRTSHSMSVIWSFLPWCNYLLQ